MQIISRPESHWNERHTEYYYYAKVQAKNKEQAIRYVEKNEIEEGSNDSLWKPKVVYIRWDRTTVMPGGKVYFVKYILNKYRGNRLIG